MSARFDLEVSVDAAQHTAELRLLDAHGVQLAYRATDFKTISAGRRRGLFDLRNYLRHYIDAGKEAAAVAEIGVCIAEEVLGQEIFERLWAPKHPRTLRIRLPEPGDAINDLAGALARVPWEIARPRADADTLGQRNLLVRVVHAMDEPLTQPLALAPGEPLRILCVFAEARGSRPLAMREERHALLELFRREVYPRRRVVAHFLSHGVTRERLVDQVKRNGGYHIVHWSGHGHLNQLELARPGGARDAISGQELLDLFDKAGGSLPWLMVLSACHSGDILRVQDWNDFLAIAQGNEPAANGSAGDEAAKEAATKDLDLTAQPGFTGTAHALLAGGVPSVVAMRYAVGELYARELALELYRALLAHEAPKPVATALTLARKALLDATRPSSRRFAVCDHATPVLYGADDPGLSAAEGESPEAHPRDPRLHQIAELSIASHAHFVGRTWELATLGSDFIGASAGAEVRPVAVVSGLGGMGKSALLAEALALWAGRFDWVLLYQAKPGALAFEGTVRDIHLKLMGELGRYHAHVKQRPAEAIHRDADADFTGPERQQRLVRNLVRALQDEAILLVLDNFETNLKPHPQTDPVAASNPSQPIDSRQVWACQDPAWDACLGTLAAGLAGTRSRVLITSRRPLAALAGTGLSLVLGPLPPGEAALYLRAEPNLGRMVFGGDADERRLAERLLRASRFHPLLMDRLARLAADPGRRAQLIDALDTLEKTKDFDQLPALFATQPGDEKELAYLNDALAASLDQLIGDAGADARRLLWMVALANEPVTLGLLKRVWGGEGPERQQLREIKRMLASLAELPAEIQAELQAMPPELRAMVDALPPEPPVRPEIAPLLRALVGVGLVTEARASADDENPDLACHELVRERIRAWMAERPEDRGELSEDGVRLAYAEWLQAFYDAMQHQNMTAALEAGGRALVYCVQARAWDRLSGFASYIVTGTNDPRILDALIPHLRIAAESAPEGRPRWRCVCYLADALRKGGPDASLQFYEEAARLAGATAEAAKADEHAARQAWSDLGSITGNWAFALGDCGDLEAAHRRQLESAEANKNAGRPAIHIIASELEALRIEIMQGHVDTALPEVEARLEQVRHWWERHRAGQSVPDAPDAEVLARAFISALDIARQADYARKDWASALGRLEAVLEVKRALERPAEDIGVTRLNRATVLGQFPDRMGEARAELEACLELFRANPAMSAKVLVALADLFYRQGDLAHAINQGRRALALSEQLPDPGDRAISHDNLANDLEQHGTPEDLIEAPRHQLAALVYRLVAGLGQDLKTSLHNYTIDFRRAQAAGTEPAVPRLAELLADPAFHPLADWLRRRPVDPTELQSALDQFIEQARHWAQEQAQDQA